jgi:aspartokinase-like uncharacterized kinase
MISVVKLGGSLLSTQVLRQCLRKITQLEGRNVVVPGGGVFADQVRAAQRDWAFDDAAAHAMAILAMQQMALLIKSLRAELPIGCSAQIVTGSEQGAIWSPELRELDQAGIPASWSVTSDSLAAWLAKRIKADRLILVKSCAVPNHASIQDLQSLGIVDAAFDQFVDASAFTTTIINKDQFLTLA